MEGELVIYQKVHTLNYRVWHLSAHLDLMRRAYIDIYRSSISFDNAAIEREIVEILERERASRLSSVFVRLSLSGDAQLKITIEERTIYSGYSLRCIRPSAAVVGFSVPFSSYFTSASESAAVAANLLAQHAGCDLAIASSDGNRLDSINDAPLFGVKNRVIYTPFARFSIEHSLAIEAAHKAQIRVVDRPLMVEDLPQLDELFFADHYGITAIFRCGDSFYSPIVAEQIASLM